MKPGIRIRRQWMNALLTTTLICLIYILVTDNDKNLSVYMWSASSINRDMEQEYLQLEGNIESALEDDLDSYANKPQLVNNNIELLKIGPPKHKKRIIAGRRKKEWRNKGNKKENEQTDDRSLLPPVTPLPKIGNDNDANNNLQYKDRMNGRPMNPVAIVQLANKKLKENNPGPKSIAKIQSNTRPHDPIGPGLPSANEVKAVVKKMMKHAWGSYKSKAWGHNEVRPLSGTIDNSLYQGASLGATIIDSLDTLIVMEMDDEYQEARNWIAYNMTFDHSIMVSAFETTIRVLGGMLSAYGLTHDPIYITKAKDIGDRLIRTFDFGVVPVNHVNLATGATLGGQAAFTAEIGTLQIEYEYLSDLTGDEKYREAVIALRDLMWDKVPKNYVVPVMFDGNNYFGTTSLGAMGDSYFEYLLKAWLLGGQTDNKQWEMYEKISDALVKTIWSDNKRKGGYSYFDTIDRKRRMDHLACFAAGMYSLGAQYHPDSSISKRDFSIAEDLTETCHASYNITPTGLGPEVIGFDKDGKIIPDSSREYILRPETVEAYFYLWRFTHDPKYRQWGWEAIQAIEKICRSEWGYAGIRDVYVLSPQMNDAGMASFFLAETLKYLYLLFSDDEVISLDNYIFNTEAHPLPVKLKRANTYKGKTYVESV